MRIKREEGRMAAKLIPKLALGACLLMAIVYYVEGDQMLGRDQGGGGGGFAPAVDVSGQWVVTHTFDNGMASVGRLDLTQDGPTISGTYTDLTGLASGMGFGLGTSLVEGKVSGRSLSIEIGPIDQGSFKTTLKSRTTITGDTGSGEATIHMNGGGKRMESRGSVEFSRGGR